ncbi:hypothetical protein NLU13_6925 [Sarocladium strictum]|uniref:L-dopachrome isomerase n=1 Tax=Sarocladium strictum TaxID=5046 RepID=A0AA39GEA6_SARSR|nr:hypothetical protein NLU13_6925 [Sarocladium strictum]
MIPQAEPLRPPTPSASSPDASSRPLPALPASSLPISTRRPTGSRKASPTASGTMKTNLEPVMEGDGRLLRDVHSPPPGDVRRLGRKASGPGLSKKRSQYFEEAFRPKTLAEKQEEGPQMSSFILAEVRTNVFIADEFNFITDLASHLSTRYNQPSTNIAISLQHGICLHFGGTFDPAYSIAIHAPHSLLQHATNRRNIALLQSHVEEAMRVGPSRGFVRFVPVSEECSGWKGNTIAGARERKRDEGTESVRDKVDGGGKEGQASPVQRKRAVRVCSRYAKNCTADHVADRTCYIVAVHQKITRQDWHT